MKPFRCSDGRLLRASQLARALLIFVVALVAFVPQSSRAQSLIVVNVHAWDCPPCIQWHNTYKKAWMNSPEFKRVRYVEIDSPTIRQAYDAKYWPDDLKPIIGQTGGRGVPRYLIVKDGRIVSDQYGVDHWSYTLADLGKLLPAVETGRLPSREERIAAAAPATGRYDGTWSVTQTCPDHQGAKGYTVRYAMTVANGLVHAQRGTNGQPDSMTLTGRIGPDGTAMLTVNGLTGASAYNVGGAQAGVPFDFPITARFDDGRGTGERTKIRPCAFAFAKL